MTDNMSNITYVTEWMRQWLDGIPNDVCRELNIGADIVVAVSSLLLFAAFVYFLKVRRGSWNRVLGLLGTLIFVAGILPLAESLRMQPVFAVAKAACAVVYVLLTTALLPLIPKILTLRNPIEVQREIAQRRRTELELRQVHSQLEGVIEQRTCELAAKNEEMEQFLNTVSHDLKNPVVTCMGLVGMVREDARAGRTEQALDSVARIERSMTRMRQLIEDLLNLSRIGRVRFELLEVDTQTILHSIAEDLELRLKQAGVILHIANDLPVVKADARWLSEVFENLITNALKYGCDNPHPQITVGAVYESAEVRFFVRDNGRGIDAAHHAQIFEPFRRLRSDKEGSGMGLAIVARIIKMHGGRVWIESALGNGATFWVALPVSTQAKSIEKLELVR